MVNEDLRPSKFLFEKIKIEVKRREEKIIFHLNFKQVSTNQVKVEHNQINTIDS